MRLALFLHLKGTLLNFSLPSANAASQILLTHLQNLEKVVLPSVKCFLLWEDPEDWHGELFVFLLESPSFSN